MNSRGEGELIAFGHKLGLVLGRVYMRSVEEHFYAVAVFIGEGVLLVRWIGFLKMSNKWI